MTSQRRFGALRKLPSGRWQARYWSPGGSRITADRTFATKTEASLFLEQVEVDQRRGIWHDPAAARSTSVRDWTWRWFDQHAASLRTSTVDSYRGLLETCVLDRTVMGKPVGLGDLGLSDLNGSASGWRNCNGTACQPAEFARPTASCPWPWTRQCGNGC